MFPKTIGATCQVIKGQKKRGGRTEKVRRPAVASENTGANVLLFVKRMLQELSKT